MRIERHLLIWGIALLALLVVVAALRDVVLPFAVAAVLAYAFNPFVDRLCRMGLHRTAAAAIVIVVLTLVFVAGLVLLLPLLFDQLKEFARTAPADAVRLREAIDSWAQTALGDRYPAIRATIMQSIAEMTQSWSSALGATLARVWTQGLAVLNVLSLLLITPVALFYFMADWPRLLARIDSWLPSQAAPTIRQVAREIDTVVAAFVRGQGIVCLILAAVYAVGLTLLGLRYGLLIGLATGILSFVPFVGWAVGLIASLAVAVAQAWPELTLAAKVAALFAVGAALDSALLSPRIVGSRIGLHPLWLIFALLALSSLLGIVGTLLAVPLAAALGVIARHLIASYLASPLFDHAPPPAPPTGPPQEPIT